MAVVVARKPKNLPYLAAYTRRVQPVAARWRALASRRYRRPAGSHSSRPSLDAAARYRRLSDRSARSLAAGSRRPLSAAEAARGR